jgi:hypothetical protein
MECLHCGECCRKMSPLTASEHEPCPSIVEVGGFTFCAIYRNRPRQCSDHDFSFARFCPVGLSVLELDGLDKIRQRIDRGWELSKGL